MEVVSKGRFSGTVERSKMKKTSLGNSQNFVVTVRSQENHTWQGTVSWVEGKQQSNFRSVLELLHLMDSAITPEEEDVEDLMNDSKTMEEVEK